MPSMERFRSLLTEALPRNRFYARKYAGTSIRPDDFREPADLARLPYLTKSELIADQQANPPYGHICTYPLDRYTRLHQSSGTTSGKALCWLDTPESWEWLLGCWQESFRLIELTSSDRAYFAFSFGPFLGFWTAFEAAIRAACLCVPGGGMTSTARLRFLIEHEATIVFCTPTYALHLAEMAAAEGIDLANSSVRALVVAGEPGGSIPATRQRIEAVWGARVFDHYGMTESGPVAIEPVARPHQLSILDEQFIAESIDPNGVEPVRPGELGELVLTNLGRDGSPLIRYRTGDLVRLREDARSATKFLDGGILGRTDDMIHLRGNNLYPAALEAVIRRFPEVAEFRIVVDQSGPLADLRIEVEPAFARQGDVLAEAVGRAVRDELLFRVEVVAVAPGTLPRFEMKARRVVKK
jgi:phenylacetate-CoA ligase